MIVIVSRNSCGKDEINVSCIVEIIILCVNFEAEWRNKTLRKSKFY